MPSVDQLRNRLLRKLYELFQLDQPDLDFGFYRIMHAKAEEVQEFIEYDLLKIVANEFREISEGRKAEFQAKYEEAIQIAESYGAPNPEKTEMVMKAKAKLDAAKDTANSEADVYDHLYRFFERYYDNGDFISRRYYTRETSSKASPFAVPYNGEEIKLHWATADQYYIKSAEYFSNFSFDLRQAQEVCNLQQDQASILRGVKDESTPYRVHFRVVEATEGEHSNVKVSDTRKRFFILHADEPIVLNENDELVVNFEYRPDPEKTGKEKSWRNKRNSEAVETILERLQAMAVEGEEHQRRGAEYLRLLKVPAPTEKDKNRSLLSKYVNRYTARNTMDYFIHKDLSGFLRRELDFYIKNEVMHLDDIENANIPSVESYLTKIKVLRKIAGKLIGFLAQLEEFQKKLWLKKKFVVETNYCITLDRVPDDFYEEVAANDAQIKEWIKLFAIDEIHADLQNPGFSQPLEPEFLKANSNLVLDTCYFEESFKAKLIASIENFDEQCDGLLIHSENFQALNLLQERYQRQAGCIYIDPPYNSPSSEIVYKNSYKHSSWLTLMCDRLTTALNLQNNQCSCVVAIDENEGNGLLRLMYEIFHDWDVSLISIEHNKKGIQGSHFSYSNEFAIFAVPYSLKNLQRKSIPKDEWQYSNLRNWGGESLRSSGRNCFYPVFVNNKEIIGFGDVSVDDFHPSGANVVQADGTVAIYPIDAKGIERKWRYARDSVESIRKLLIVDTANTGDLQVRKAKADEQFKTMWYNSKYNAGDYGTKVLSGMGFDKRLFDFSKSIHTVRDCIFAVSGSGDLIIDYFAGSGTTGHSVINLNREDNGNRKYILIEMGDYFDTVLKPRIAKTVYSESWRDGRPITHHTGVSHCIKYIRLESYEDTLNNLRFKRDSASAKALNASPTLKEDYMLNYLLDVETRGSQSLLNIDAFANPTSYTLKVKKPGTDEYMTQYVDLIETFNYLIGLRILRTFEPQTFRATFKRSTDPELPDDQRTKLVVDDDGIQQDASGTWWFRKVEGWVPKDTSNPNNGQREKVLIIWRRLNGDIEQDNLMLDEWFQNNRFGSREFEFDTIYVNGSNNLLNLKSDDENWKVHLIEDEFMKRMWGGEIV